jgi:hypothetical protein
MAIESGREPIKYWVERYGNDDAPDNDRQKWSDQDQRPISQKSKANYSNYENHEFFVRCTELWRLIIVVHCCGPLGSQGHYRFTASASSQPQSDFARSLSSAISRRHPCSLSVFQRSSRQHSEHKCTRSGVSGCRKSELFLRCTQAGRRSSTAGTAETK